MDRQTVRGQPRTDRVRCCNAEGLAGLSDRGAPGRSPRLSAGQRAELARIVEAGPDLATDGVVPWRRVDL